MSPSGSLTLCWTFSSYSMYVGLCRVYDANSYSLTCPWGEANKYQRKTAGRVRT